MPQLMKRRGYGHITHDGTSHGGGPVRLDPGTSVLDNHPEENLKKKKKKKKKEKKGKKKYFKISS